MGPNLTNSAEPLPQGASSLATQASHSEAENDADPSTLATTPVVLSSSRKSPLTAGESRGARTYAYRTAPSHQLSSPVHPTSTPELSPTAHSTIPPIPVPSTSKQLSGRNVVLPSGGPSETRDCSATSRDPPSSKQQSKRKRRREESKEASSSATMPPATTKTPSPTKSTPTTLTAVEDRDVCNHLRREDGQTESIPDATAMHANIQSEQGTIARPGGEQVGSGEGVGATGEIVNAEPILDDPLNMQAGLVVNGVSFPPRRQYRLLTTSLSQWPYTALSKIRHSVLMSIIGVVSSITKEPSQSQTGGTRSPIRPLPLLTCLFRLVHLLVYTGSLCPGLVWWCSLRKRCRHQG